MLAWNKTIYENIPHNLVLAMKELLLLYLENEFLKNTVKFSSGQKLFHKKIQKLKDSSVFVNSEWLQRVIHKLLN